MKTLSKRERLLRAINHEEVDRIPYSIWPHYPETDLHPESLAEAQVRDAVNYGFDFIKIANNGLYSVIDYGTEYLRNNDGSPSVDKYGTLNIGKYGVKILEDFKNLKVLDPCLGHLSQQLKAAYYMKNLISKNSLEDMPVLMTIYSPLTSAYKLAGKFLLESIKEHENIVRCALNVIADTTVNFIRECLKIGIDGFFFASQMSNYSYFTEEQYDDLGKKYDMKLFEAFTNETIFNIVHIHGENAMFNKLAEYPANCLNWHDRWIGPSLDEVRKTTGKCLLGGIDEENILGVADDEKFGEHVRQAIKTGGKRGFILGPGCTAYPNLPEGHLEIIQKILKEA